jgi:23S rRNA (adenine2030-N6)-methyltransferase
VNYRHAFHAGNFADLLKHAILTRLLGDLTASGGPLTVIDTHAGAGLYDLSGSEARRTGEGRAGIGRLMADPAAPAAFEALKAAVRRANAPGAVRYYPGSPVLIAEALRPRDRYIACELRPDDHAALKQVLPRELGAVALRIDGWAHAANAAPAAPQRLLLLIDPPFESGDDYHQTLHLTASVLSVNPAAVVAIWLPIKDLTTYDGFLGEMEDLPDGSPLWSAEVRLRPLTDPMRLNGCAMIVVNAPVGLAAHARLATAWVAREIGEAGAVGRVTALGERP